MLVAIYHILKDSVVFKDLGADYYNQFNKERKINAYLKKLKALGWEAPVVAAYYGYQRPHLCPQAAIICFVTAGAEQSFILLDCLTS